MTLSSALEKAARAMYEGHCARHPYLPASSLLPWDMQAQKICEEYQINTRACVLAFLKECGVTEKMIDVGRVQFWCDPEERDLNEGTKAAWSAMKAALIREIEG